MICESLKHQNTIDGWYQKVKTAARQVIDAEEMVLRFPDAPELRVRLNVAWEEYWAISQMAISVLLSSYEAAGGPTVDLHRLDGDNDGIARESLPGAPYESGTKLSCKSKVTSSPPQRRGAFRRGVAAGCNRADLPSIE